MGLRDWIFNSRQVASAIHARVAIPNTQLPLKIAEIATLALATNGKEKKTTTDEIGSKVDWLKNCPVCAGHEFYEALAGGYFCPACQPRPAEEIMRRVKGPPATRATGSSCRACSCNTYMGIVGGFLCEACKRFYATMCW